MNTKGSVNKCIHCVVTGRVQGVFYRASTQEMAARLGLSGWVRNMANGNVEVEACGSVESIEVFKSWLSEGPPHAVVSNVACNPTGGESVVKGDFEICY